MPNNLLTCHSLIDEALKFVERQLFMQKTAEIQPRAKKE